MGQTDKIRDIADSYTKEIDSYKQYAEARRNSRTYTQEHLLAFYERMKDYIKLCKESGEPMTIGGLCIAMGIDRTALHRMKTGFYDWRLFEYMDIVGVKETDIKEEADEFFKGFQPLQYWIDEKGDKVLLMMYSEVVSIGLAFIEAENEAGLFSNKPVGRIFYLKSMFGYSDTHETTPNRTPESIVAPEKARMILAMLDNDENDT